MADSVETNDCLGPAERFELNVRRTYPKSLSYSILAGNTENQASHACIVERRSLASRCVAKVCCWMTRLRDQDRNGSEVAAGSGRDAGGKIPELRANSEFRNQLDRGSRSAFPSEQEECQNCADGRSGGQVQTNFIDGEADTDGVRRCHESTNGMAGEMPERETAWIGSVCLPSGRLERRNSADVFKQKP